MRRRWRVVFLSMVATAILPLTACNDDDTASPGPSTTQVQTATTLNDTPYCQSLQRFNERYGRINPSIGDPAQLRTAMEDAVSSVREAEAVAPPEIKADLATLNTGLQQLIAVFARANFDLSQVQASDLEQLQTTPELEAASRRLDAYARDNCL